MTDTQRHHLAIFIPNLNGGGAERVMVTLANHFVAKGYCVDLVLAQATGTYIVEVASGVRIIDLKSSRILTSMLPLVRYLRRERPDAMLSALSHVNIIAILARKLAGVRMRLVISERNSLTSLSSDRLGKILRHLMAWFYPSSDAVIAVTQAGAQELIGALRLSKEMVFAIPNPVDIERVRALSVEALNHPWFDTGAPPVILAVGRLSLQKDFGTLIQAFAQLRSQLPARLVILGKGPLWEELECQVAKLGLTRDVYMPGFQENPFCWMARSHLFVLSSRFEGFPNVLVQAMACGARVVSTNCPTGPDEILEGGRWGRLVPVGDAGALACAMHEALKETTQPDVRVRVSAFKTEIISQNYLAILSPAALK